MKFEFLPAALLRRLQTLGTRARARVCARARLYVRQTLELISSSASKSPRRRKYR